MFTLIMLPQHAGDKITALKWYKQTNKVTTKPSVFTFLPYRICHDALSPVDSEVWKVWRWHAFWWWKDELFLLDVAVCLCKSVSEGMSPCFSVNPDFLCVWVCLQWRFGHSTLVPMMPKMTVVYCLCDISQRSAG